MIQPLDDKDEFEDPFGFSTMEREWREYLMRVMREAFTPTFSEKRLLNLENYGDHR